MQTGDTVRLTGVSQKGKNRLREHGDLFTVAGRFRAQAFDNAEAWRLECLGGRNGNRLVRVHDDRDFTIEVIGNIPPV